MSCNISNSFRTSPFQSSITAYFGEFHCNKNRAKWLSKINIFSFSAFVIQPLMSLALIATGIDISLFGSFAIKPWRLFLFFFSLLPLICFVILWNLPESPKFLFNQGKEKETLAILNEIHRVNHKNDKEKVVCSRRSSNKYVCNSYFLLTHSIQLKKFFH